MAGETKWYVKCATCGKDAVTYNESDRDETVKAHTRKGHKVPKPMKINGRR